MHISRVSLLICMHKFVWIVNALCTQDEETYEFALYRSVCFGQVFSCPTVIPLSHFFFPIDNGELSGYNIGNKHSEELHFNAVFVRWWMEAKKVLYFFSCHKI